MFTQLDPGPYVAAFRRCSEEPSEAGWAWSPPSRAPQATASPSIKRRGTPQRRPLPEPRRPRLLLACRDLRRVVAEELRADEEVDLLAGPACAHEAHPARGLVEDEREHPIADRLDRAGERRDAGRARGDPVALLRLGRHAERAGELRPGVVRRAARRADGVDRRDGLAAEVGEVDLQPEQGLLPAGLEGLDRAVPRLAVAEAAHDDAHHARPAAARLDEELGRGDVGGLGGVGHPPRLLVGEAMRGVVGDDGAGRLHVRLVVVDDRAADVALDVRGHEPRRDAGPGGDRLPGLLRRRGYVDLDLDTALCGHGVSFGTGWEATTSRCGLPSSWW